MVRQALRLYHIGRSRRSYGRKSGGSDAPARILDEAGIDIRKAEFWQGGFDVISDLIAQLEALPVKVLQV